MTDPQVVLISGGTRGIGAATARHLAALGHRVVVTSRRVRDAAPPAPGVAVLPLDITDPASVLACVAAVLDRHGRLDALVNNAGHDLYGAVEEVSEAEFAAQIDTNLMGAIRLTRAVLPGMRERGRGRIVQISSLGGQVALPMNAAYAASKFGLEGFSESLRHEVRRLGIHVCLIVPAAVATETLDSSILEAAAAVEPYAARRRALVARMRRDGAASRVGPDDVARAVAGALAHRAPPLRIAVGAQARLVLGLRRLLPQAAFEAMMGRLFP